MAPYGEASARATSRVPTPGTGAVAAAARARLIGDGGPPDPHLGLRLLAEADAAGEPEAALLLANLAAAGAWRTQDWPEALAHLVRAADRGSGFARDQLAVLARADDPGIAPEGLARRIDLDRLLSSGPRRPLCEAPRVRMVDLFASPGECAWLISRARGRLRPAKMLAAHGAVPQYSTQRNNSDFILDITTTDLVVQALRERMSRLIGLPTVCFQPPQILHYAEGQELKPHFDFLDRSVSPELAGRMGEQVVTVLVWLNEDFEAGETDFPKAGARFRGGTGDALMFANVDANDRPDPMSLHAGLPPRGGEKWLFSQWIRNRAVAAAA